MRVYEADTETLSVFGVGPARAEAAAAADRLRQRRHADAAPARDPRRPDGTLHAHRRRVAELAPDGADRRAAAPDGRRDRDDRRTRAADDRGRRRPADLVRAPGRERAGEVRRPARRPLRARGRDDRRRAAPDPRPHRDDARGRRREDPAPAEERVRLAGRAARAGHGRGAGRLLLRGAAHRRDDAPRRLRADRARRQPEPAADRPPRRARADGRPRHRLQPPADRRRGRRRPRRPLRRARRTRR